MTPVEWVGELTNNFVLKNQVICLIDNPFKLNLYVYCFNSAIQLYHILMFVTFCIYANFLYLYSNLKMTLDRSKRRSFLLLIFITKSLSKKLAIEILVLRPSIEHHSKLDTVFTLLVRILWCLVDKVRWHPCQERMT